MAHRSLSSLVGFEISPEVKAKARPGCIVRLRSRTSFVTHILGISETKKYKIPNDTFAILTELTGTEGKYYLATIIFEHGICVVKACEIAEVVYAAEEEES